MLSGRLCRLYIPHDLAIDFRYIDLQLLPPVNGIDTVCKDWKMPTLDNQMIQRYDKYLQYYICRKLYNYEDL